MLYCQRAIIAIYHGIIRGCTRKLLSKQQRNRIRFKIRFHQTNQLAKGAAASAATSQRSARLASQNARSSAGLAQAAADNALASQRAALAAEVKAHVYLLPATAMAAIKASLVGVPPNTTAFISCSAGLEEVCRQLAGAFRVAGLVPTVKPAASYWTGGFDVNPLTKTSNPNVSVGYTARYEQTARAIDRALAGADLRTELVPFSSNTTEPNLAIDFLYPGEPP